MRFNIGQRVRIARVFNEEARSVEGSITTVIGYGPGQEYEYELACKHPNGMNWHAPERCLEPIDDDADYKRFMERVMKPVQIGDPVAA